MLAAADMFLFEDFRLDRRGEGLSRRDERGNFVPISVGPRALDVLAVLVERPGQLVLKEEIMGAVWGRTVVENANLTVQISALRRVLDQGRSEGSCIQTVAARGYRFVATVARVDQEKGSGTETKPLVIGGDGAVGATAIIPEHVASTSTITDPPDARSPLVRNRRLALARIPAAVALAIVAVAAIWWTYKSSISNPTPVTATVAGPQAASAPRLSIVVVPFADLSEHRGQQYLADGITEDVTTDLSRIPGMFVISRNTAFNLRDKQIDAKQIGRELGVRFVLEGSVRRSGGQLRVNNQLIDAQTGAHLWAERFDREISDLFAVENEIASRIAVALNLELVAAEAARPSGKPDALEYVLRGRAAMTRGPPTREGYAEAIGFFEQALAVEPNSIDAQGWLALALAARVLDEISAAPAEDFQRAEGLLAAALAAAPRNPSLHYVKGQILRAVAQGQVPSFRLSVEARVARFADAIPEYETMLAANPNEVRALGNLAWCKFMTGAEEEAIPLLEKVIRLSPRDPFLYLWYTRLGHMHLFGGRLDEAIAWLEKARRAYPSYLPPHRLLAAAYGLKGDSARATAELGEALQLGKDDLSTISRTRVNSNWVTPALRERYENIYLVGLRKAGMPEE